MRKADRDAYLNGSDEFRAHVKDLMERQWQAKGTRKPVNKVQWTMPGYRQAELIKDEDR